MGLDVYLYRYNNREEVERLEAEYESVSKSNWPKDVKYENLTDEQKDAVRLKNKEFAKSIGLKENGEHPEKERIEIDSNYPDHYFKIGYFRSSYNESGINRILSNLGLDDLYKVFNRSDDDSYVFQPDWEMAKVRVSNVIEQLKQTPNLRCFHVGWNEFKGNPNNAKITNDQQALEVFIEHSKRWDNRPDDDAGHSNSEGEFFPKGLKVFGLVSGVNKRFFVEESLPCTYVITEGENEWYVQALEIVKATIAYVLSQPDKDKFYLHWSS